MNFPIFAVTGSFSAYPDESAVVVRGKGFTWGCHLQH
jgi:hypothetical protein